MSKPPLFFVIFLAIVAILASRQFIKQRRESEVNDASPIRTMLVEVKNKRDFPSPNRRSRQREEIVAEDMKYEVLFHPLNGAGDLTVVVKEREYQQINVGAQGELRMQGTRYIGFTPK
ncbi:hypothetical protein CIG19_13170 [Enterobacterales bacterium CwR94]|nr:hypothetical protein CIG19_13170 [Enterobacterales bacterium CwR94]